MLLFSLLVEDDLRQMLAACTAKTDCPVIEIMPFKGFGILVQPHVG